jgi:FAD:protein FMN transferase
MSESPRNGAEYPSRRDVLAVGVGVFVAAAFPWTARSREAPVRRSIPVMGTVAEITVVHRDANHAQRAIDAAFGELRWVEATMTRFRDDSDVGRANLHAATSPVAVSSATAAVLAEALHWARASDGRFDPALAGAVALWDVGRRREPPETDRVRAFARRGLFREVEIGTHAGSDVVRFHAPEASLDLGGIAKGYGVDRAADALRAWGIGHALIGVGGDLYALGRSPAGEPWEIGIRSPDDPSKIAATLPLEDAAIATSGDYEQFFDYSGRRYHHLLDPRTGEPRRSDTRTVSVIASSCMAADAAATTVFGCARPEAADLLKAAGRGSELVHLL